MVQSTIGLAHSLGRKVVAEGVEQRDILDALVEMNCDIAQGFADRPADEPRQPDQAALRRSQAPGGLTFRCFTSGRFAPSS